MRIFNRSSFFNFYLYFMANLIHILIQLNANSIHDSLFILQQIQDITFYSN